MLNQQNWCKKSLRVMLTTAIAVTMSSCAGIPPKNGTAVNDIQDSLDEAIASTNTPVVKPPPAVNDALLPPININVPVSGRVSEPRFDIAVNDANAQQFFMGLVEGTNTNMVVHPNLTGQISLTLKDVTIAEVMEVLRNVYGYEYEKSNNVYQVLPRRLQSRVFQVNYLNVTRRGKSNTRVSSGQISQPTADSTDTGSSGSNNSTTISNGQDSENLSGSQVETESEADFWSEMEAALIAIIGKEDGRSVVSNPHSGVVVVRAMPAELREIEQFILATQDVVERQVILEAKILEVQLDDGFRSGINWSILGRPGDGKTITGTQTGGGSIFDTGQAVTAGALGTLNPQNQVPISGADVSSFGGVFSLALNLNDFTGFIELLETQGNVQVLSSPRVSTINNQKAVIKVGTDEFFVTSVSNNTTISGNATTSVPSVTLTPFFSGIALDVIPQIDENDSVIMHIHPVVSEVVEQIRNITVGGQSQSLPLARSSVRESDSIVRAQSNQIIVIGGLIQNSTTEDVASVPFLGDLPVVGSLFRQTQQNSTKSELVILLKPIVVNSSLDWKKRLQQSSKNFKRLDQGFHYGGKSEVFGSEAER